jgi:hypothetical protein
METQTMIDAKEAIQKALVYLGDIFQGQDLKGVRLEEVVYGERTRCWYVTLSFRKRDMTPIDLAAAIGKGSDREYKVVAVSDVDGSFRSVKTPQVQR